MIHIHVDSMKAAERLSGICREYTHDIYLCSEQFHIDPKSTLGILAMMYSSRDSMFLDVSALGSDELSGFLEKIDEYIVREDGRSAG